jgi:hypothetical protein
MPTGTLWDVLLHETMTFSERLEAFAHMVQAGVRFGEEYTSARLVSALCEEPNQEVLVFMQTHLAQLKQYDERVWDLDGDGYCMNNQLYTKGLFSNPKGVEVALTLGANPLFQLKDGEYWGLTPREALEQDIQGSYDGVQISRDTLALRDAIEILWHAEQRQRRESIAVAMAMGHHRRLGANTQFNTLPQDQMHLILDQVLHLYSRERVPLQPLQVKSGEDPSYRPRMR